MMMGGLYGGGTMMGGGSYGWMTGTAGYQWMMGGAGAPAWMRGQALPGFMTATSSDPGQVMGSLFANAPGPRVSAAQAGLGSQVPAGATLDRAANRITFTGTSVRLTVLASPAGGPDDRFRIAGLTDPAITVPAGAQVSIDVINADPGTAHGLVITAGGTTSSPMPMLTARPAFPGSAVWFLGNPTPAGMHAATLELHRRHARNLPVPVPGPRARTRRHDRNVHRQRHLKHDPAAVLACRNPCSAWPRQPESHDERGHRPRCSPAFTERLRTGNALTIDHPGVSGSVIFLELR